MDVTRSEFQDLVGAYALDACDPDEAAAMDAYVADHEEAAAEAERLRVVAAWLGAAGALHPPTGLRDRLLTAVEPVAPLPSVDALRRETARFEMLLDSLDADDLTVSTENGLSVRDLATHVAIIDEAFVAAATDPSVFIGADFVAELTRAQLPETADWSFDRIRDRVRAARAALVDLDAQYPDDARVGGYARASVLVIRAFETWTHCHDIAVATKRPEPPAEPPVLRTMADLAVQTLPLALAARGFSYPGRTARVVLTGPGGGDWTFACDGRAPGAVPDVVLRVPVVEFCRRFADRLTVDEVPFSAEGDTELGRALVDAAPAFAGL